jgi:hypothetical protein
MANAIRASETSVITRATRRNIPEDIILRSHRPENLSSYKLCTLMKGAIECGWYEYRTLVGADWIICACSLLSITEYQFSRALSSFLLICE